MRAFAATILACGVLAIRLREAGTAGTAAMPDPNAPLSPPVQTDDPNYVMPPSECTGAATDPAYCGPMEPGAQGAEIPIPTEDVDQEPLVVETPPGECTGAATDPATCGPLEPGAQGAEIPTPPAGDAPAGDATAGGPPAGGPPAGGPPAGGPPAAGGTQGPVPPVTGDAVAEEGAV